MINQQQIFIIDKINSSCYSDNNFILTELPVKVAEFNLNTFNPNKNIININNSFCVTNPLFRKSLIKINVLRIDNNKQINCVYTTYQTLLPADRNQNLPSKNNISFHYIDYIQNEKYSNIIYSLYVQIDDNITDEHYTEPYISGYINFNATHNVIRSI